jgi:hypothetical protein
MYTSASALIRKQQFKNNMKSIGKVKWTDTPKIVLKLIIVVIVIVVIIIIIIIIIAIFNFRPLNSKNIQISFKILELVWRLVQEHRLATTMKKIVFLYEVLKL